MSSKLAISQFETPLGEMVALATEKGICLLEFADRKELQTEIEALQKEYGNEPEALSSEHLELLKTELAAYFNEQATAFTVPLDLKGTTFQKSVWEALLEIPYGETRTYKEQSLVLGDLKAIRAVASANGKNQIAIVVPCHRVIGSDGNLTGYAGGIERKRFLLNLERKVAGPKDLFSL